MSKKIISDIIFTKKSIRQIPLTADKKIRLESELKNIDEDNRELHLHKMKNNVNWQRKPINPKILIWPIAIICLIILFFTVSAFFSSVTIYISPKTEKISFNNETYTAKSSSRGLTEISFEVLNVKQEDGETITATEEKDVNQKASGTIIIYNNYTTASQRLTNNTRFEANNGKIYRISTYVIVPGLKTENGKSIPGSVEAVVYADQAGDNYNIKVSDLTGDFKIPGFKGDPRYTAFYGRLKTDIIGGYIGKQRIVADSVRQTTEDLIKVRLKEQLLKELYAIKPENYIIFKDSYSVDYTSLADTAVNTDKVKINLEGSLHSLVFNNIKLSGYLAARKMQNFNNLQTELIPSDNFEVSYSAKDNINLWKNDSIDLKFTGDVTVKWLYVADDLKRQFSQNNNTDLNSLMQNYKDSINSMRIIFTPVWTRKIPDSINKIKIKEEIL